MIKKIILICCALPFMIHSKVILEIPERKFDGTKEYSVPGEKYTLETFSVSLWLKHDPIERYGKSSIFKMPAGNGYDYGGRMWSERKEGNAEIFWGMNTGRPNTMKGGIILDSRFNFIVLTVDGPTVEIYINGKKNAERIFDNKIRYMTKDFSLRLGVCHYPILQGTIRNFKIHDTVLTREEIAELYKDEYIEIPVQQPMPTQKNKPETNVRYYKTDELEVVTGADGVNLLQNPSFEVGLSYWNGIYTGTSDKPYHIGISSKEAYSGNRSVFLQVWQDGASAGLGSFAIEVKPGENYHLSFYTKADSPVNLGVRIVSGKWPVFPVSQFVRSEQEWKRYEFSFTAPDNIAQVYFYGPPRQPMDTRIYLDAIQLKHGNDSKPFQEQSFSSCLETNRYGNIFTPGETVSGQIKLMIPGAKAGRMKLGVYDFNKKLLAEKTYSFKINEKELVVIPISLTECINGINILRADIELTDGKKYTDFYRIGVLPQLKEPFWKAHFFAANGVYCFPDSEKNYELFRQYGFGALTGGFFRAPSRLKSELQAQHGFLDMSSVFFGGSFSKSRRDELNNRSDDPIYNVKKNFAELTDGEWCEVMRRIEEKVRETPHCLNWKMINEISAWHLTDERLEKFMAFCRDTAQAIRKGNPNASVISPDETNIYVTGGARSIDKKLTAGMGDFIDILSIHAYRPHPETPDLDSDLANLAEILRKHKFNKPVWITENMNYMPYQIPSIGWEVDNHSATDNARGKALSYDSGSGERLAVAYCARTFLITLKHSDMIDVSTQWTANSNSFILDAAGTQRAYGFAVNTIARLLNHLKFKKEIAINDSVKCYIFENSTKSVAAIWNSDRSIDIRKYPPTAVYNPFAAGEAVIIDLMGNSVQMAEADRIPVTSTPLFFCRAEIPPEQFAEKLQNIRQEGGQSRLFKIRENITANGIELTLNSRLQQPCSGMLTGFLNGRDILSRKYSIASGNDYNFKLPLSAEEFSDYILEFKNDDNNSVFKYSSRIMPIYSPRRKSEITVDGNLADWTISGIPLIRDVAEFKKKDDKKAPEATFYSCWDNEYFYIALSVRSSTFSPPVAGKPFWMADSVQIYFDTNNDGRHSGSMFDNNDYAYSIFADADHKVHINRDVVPEWQLCFLNKGKAPEIKGAFRRTTEGFVYEAAFPVSALAPMLFEPGRVFGFSILVNSMDSGTRLGRVLMPDNLEPYNNTHLWPTMIMVE